jgi:hypothetical protein
LLSQLLPDSCRSSLSYGAKLHSKISKCINTAAINFFAVVYQSSGQRRE